MTTVYTDGGCTGNPGPGGWAAILLLDGETLELSGGEPMTTNNRMELTAAIRALETLKSRNTGSPVLVHTDSEYVKNGITSWIRQWKANGWRTSAKKEVKNQDLWMELDRLAGQMDVKWQWVKGHSGVPLNERCDVLVAAERDRFSQGY